MGAVQGRRLPGRRGARPGDPSARRRPRASPRTAAASGSSTTSRRCARSTPKTLQTARPRSCRRARCSSASARSAAGSKATPRSPAPNPPNGAVITYYQRARHLFGTLKIEVLDAKGKLRRHDPGEQAPRHQPRHVVDARQAAARAAGRADRVQRDAGPARAARHVHGAHDQGQGRLRDEARRRRSTARAPYTAADRKAQFDAAMKRARAVRRHERPRRPDQRRARAGRRARAAKLPANDALRKQLRGARRQGRRRSARRSSRPRKAARSPARSACASTWTRSTARSCRTTASRPTTLVAHRRARTRARRCRKRFRQTCAKATWRQGERRAQGQGHAGDRIAGTCAGGVAVLGRPRYAGGAGTRLRN